MTLTLAQRETSAIETADPGFVGSIASYTVVALLGGGAHGAVYRAVQSRSGLKFAIKWAHDRAADALIRTELALLSAVGKHSHAGIVRVFDSGEREGRTWYAMEELDGSLEEFYQSSWGVELRYSGARRRNSPAEGYKRTFQILRSLASALEQLQVSGFVHGDLSLSNVLLRGPTEAVIGDWGGQFSEASAADGSFGTLGFCAPERLLAQGWDSRADIYSFGCIAYCLLAGRPVFVSNDAEGLYRQHLHARPLRVLLQSPGVPESIDTLVMSALEKSPWARLPRASQIVDCLDELLGQVPQQRGPLDVSFRSRLVGREPCLAAARAAIAKGANAVVVVGEAGSGKTRLLQDIGREFKSSHALVVLGPATTEALPLALFRPIVRLALGKQQYLEAEQQAQLRQLDAYFSLEVDPFEGLPLESDEDRRRHIFSALCLATELAVREKATLWVLDDLDQADALSKEFIRWFCNRDGVSSTFLVGMRPVTDDLLNADFWGTRSAIVNLPPLSWRETFTVLVDTLGVSTISGEVVDSVYWIARGNPLGTARVINALLREKQIESIAGCAAFRPGREPIAFSWRLLDESLSNGVNQTVACAAAVLGRDVYMLELDQVLEGNGVDVANELERMVSQGILIRVDPTHFRFTHDVVRAALERHLSNRESVNYHARIALILETNGAERNSARVGQHWAKALEPTKAIPYLRRAARQLQARAAIEDAVELLQQAFELSREQNELHIRTARIGLELMDLLGRAARHADVVRVARLCIDLLPSASLIRARAQRAASLACRVMNDYHNADIHLKDGLETTARLKQASVAVQREWLELQICALKLHYVQHKTQQSLDLLRQVIPVVRQTGTPHQKVEVYTAAANAILLSRRFRFTTTALRYQHRALGVSERAQLRGDDLVVALFGVAFVLLFGGPVGFQEADDALARAEVLASGNALWLSRVLAYRSIAARRMHQVSHCERFAERAIEHSVASGLRGYVGVCYANFAWIALMRDQPESAATQVARARKQWWRPNRTPDSQQSEYPLQWLANLPLLAVQAAEGDLVACGDTIEELLHERQAQLSNPVHANLVKLRGDALHLRGITEVLRLASVARYL